MRFWCGWLVLMLISQRKASLRCSALCTPRRRKASPPRRTSPCSSSACGTGPMRADTVSSFHCACPLANARYRFTVFFFVFCCFLCVFVVVLFVFFFLFVFFLFFFFF